MKRYDFLPRAVASNCQTFTAPRAYKLYTRKSKGISKWPPFCLNWCPIHLSLLYFKWQNLVNNTDHMPKIHPNLLIGRKFASLQYQMSHEPLKLTLWYIFFEISGRLRVSKSTEISIFIEKQHLRRLFLQEIVILPKTKWKK